MATASLEPAQPGQSSARPGRHLLAPMTRLEIKERRLWLTAVAVTIVSAIGMVSLALPAHTSRVKNLSGFFLAHPVVFLFALVLIFNACMLQEQMQIRGLRQEVASQLYEMSVLDPLTGLFNRRYVEHRLEEELARCQRTGSSITVILFDLNGLKQINDEHGHAAGDRALKAFAERLKAATRGSDVPARYGGDEFLLVLAECKADGVLYVLKRLRNLHIESEKQTLPISYSVGSADYIAGESSAAILKRADAALYANKRKVPGTRSEQGSPVLVT